jgi:hypothetical protein
MDRVKKIKETFKVFVKGYEKPISDKDYKVLENAFIAGALWADGHPNWHKTEKELPQDGTFVVAVDLGNDKKEVRDLIMGEYYDKIMPEDYNEEEKKWYGPIEQSIHSYDGCDNVYNYTHWMYLYKPE